MAAESELIAGHIDRQHVELPGKRVGIIAHFAPEEVAVVCSCSTTLCPLQAEEEDAFSSLAVKEGKRAGRHIFGSSVRAFVLARQF